MHVKLENIELKYQNECETCPKKAFLV